MSEKKIIRPEFFLLMFLLFKGIQVQVSILFPRWRVKFRRTVLRT